MRPILSARLGARGHHRNAMGRMRTPLLTRGPAEAGSGPVGTLNDGKSSALPRRHIGGSVGEVQITVLSGSCPSRQPQNVFKIWCKRHSA